MLRSGGNSYSGLDPQIPELKWVVFGSALCYTFSGFNLTIEIKFATRRGRFVNVVTFWEEQFILF